MIFGGVAEKSQKIRVFKKKYTEISKFCYICFFSKKIKLGLCMYSQLYDRIFQHRLIKTPQAFISLLDSNEQGNKEDPAVLFLHGHCANKNFFQNQLKAKAFQDYRLLALDLPGYGNSSTPEDPDKVYCFTGFADIVAEVIQTKNLENIIVVGWSLGGHVALELTTRLPQIKGLLITGAPPIEVSSAGLAKGFKTNPKLLECFGKAKLTYEEAELFASISGYNYSDEKKFILDAVLNTDEGARTIYPRSIFKGKGLNQVKIVSEWPHPIAVVAGEKDIGINNQYIINDVKFKNLWTNKVYSIQGGGHAVFIERFLEFNAILLKFLKDVAPLSAYTPV